MMTRTSLVLLLVLLVLSDNADAARKLPKRPAKPLKTFPRNNATPSIAAAAAPVAAESAAAPPAPTETAETAQQAASSGSELPKPLTPLAANKQPAEAALAEPGATPVNGESKSDDQNATAAPQGSQIEPEDCEPDMIGFELTTG